MKLVNGWLRLLIDLNHVVVGRRKLPWYLLVRLSLNQLG